MKKIGGLLLSLVLAVTLTACGKQPTAEIDAARVAIDAAVSEGAEKYTADDLQAVNTLLAAAMEEIKTQDGKLFKNYKKAQDDLAQVKAGAEALKTKVATVKEELKAAAEAGLQEATAAVTEAKAMLENAPVGKGSLADIEMMKADVAGLEAALTEVQPLIEGSEYAAASEKSSAIKERALSVTEEIRMAQEKAAAAKLATRK